MAFTESTYNFNRFHPVLKNKAVRMGRRIRLVLFNSHRIADSAYQQNSGDQARNDSLPQHQQPPLQAVLNITGNQNLIVPTKDTMEVYFRMLEKSWE
jgi:hypothetical protein